MGGAGGGRARRTYFGGLGNAFAKDFDFDLAERGVQCDGHLFGIIVIAGRWRFGEEKRRRGEERRCSSLFYVCTVGFGGGVFFPGFCFIASNFGLD